MKLSFLVADIRDLRSHVVSVWLPPESLSVLTQVRKTLNIEDLMPSILASGQETAGRAAALEPNETLIYLEGINRIWKTEHTLNDLTPVWLDGEAYYLPLIAGHRRHQTCMAINHEVGRGAETFTENYKGLYRVDLYFGISAAAAIKMQFNENRHVSVPPHEEAEAAWLFWRHEKAEDPELTTTQFARSIGRTNEWVKNALRFCDLPDEIQGYVKGDNPAKLTLSYGVLVSLARLAEEYKKITEEDFPEQAYLLWIQQAIAGRLNTTSFGKAVSAYLENKKLEQAGQFSLFGGNDDTTGSTRRTRRVVAENVVRGLWAFSEYFKAVERARTAGLLGSESYLQTPPEAELYSPGSPIRLCSDMTEVLFLLVPHLAELARLEGRGGSRKLKASMPDIAAIRAGLRALHILEAQQHSLPN